MLLRVMWFVPPAIAVVAQARGPVRVEGERNLSSQAQFEALSRGTVDAVVTSMDNVMAWNRLPGPQDFRIVAQLERSTPLSLVARRGFRELGHLRGTVILVDSASNGFVVALRAMLQDGGLQTGDYTLRETGGVRERLEGLRSSLGAATLLGPPFDAMAMADGMEQLGRVQESYPDFPGQGLVMRDSASPEVREAVRTWLADLQQAGADIARQPENAYAAMAATGLPAPAIEAMLADRPASLQPSRAGIALLIRQRGRFGLPGADDEYATLVDTDLLPPPLDTP
ncbi:ABC transporter substrate-binding protein [Variovorax sp. LT1R16]|uniref:ABC transporter substrate-binding protein n=1 Tax=Variovorax sp. LT1R16 TaxID=3443728 RepID=UPI003F44B7FE